MTTAARQLRAPHPETVTVELGPRSYPIVIGSHLLESLGPRLADLFGGGQATVITNPVVGALHLAPVMESMRVSGFQVTSIEIPDGEAHKNLAWLSFIYDRLLDARLDRTCPIIALGGGVIGDLAGFAAATFLRGVPFVQVPTTLLAQVDSSVGGKTAINHPVGKNLIGAFYQPRLVLIDIDTLTTLPRREFAAGVAEVIKYGAILDADLFTLLERELGRILAHDAEALQQVVEASCRLKAAVVARDECESGYRAILNFGHTMAHAIETLTEYKRYLHGEAVAIGMVFAAHLSERRGYCSPATVERLRGLLVRAGLPVELPRELFGPSLALTVAGDKKAAGGKVKFVCLEDLGRTRFDYLTGEEIAAAATQ